MKKSDEVLCDNISDNINLEKSVMEKFDTELVWNYLKKKGGNVSKIMYLYYYEDLTIKMSEKCSVLNKMRSKYSKVLNEKINKELKDLEMKNASFCVDIKYDESS